MSFVTYSCLFGFIPAFVFLERTQSNTKNRNRKHWLCLECREVFLSSHLYKVHNCTKIQKIETRSKKRKNFIEEKHIKTEILSDIDHRNDDDVEDDNQDYDDYHHEDGYHEEDYQEGQHADGDYLDTFKNDKEIDGDQAKEESKDKGKTKRPTKVIYNIHVILLIVEVFSQYQVTLFTDTQ